MQSYVNSNNSNNNNHKSNPFADWQWMEVPDQAKFIYIRNLFLNEISITLSYHCASVQQLKANGGIFYQ